MKIFTEIPASQCCPAMPSQPIPGYGPQSSSCCAASESQKAAAGPQHQSLDAGSNGFYKPLVAVALIVIHIFFFLPSQFDASLAFTGRALLDIAPWLALSVGLSAFAKASGADALVARAFSGSPARMIVLASLFGALSPFCSCGVVPVVAGLLGAGVPLAPVMAFWMSSPLMDPNMFMLTAASLGIEFAVIKTLAAVGMGLLSGAMTHALVSRGWVKEALRLPGTAKSPSDSRAPNTRLQWKVWSTPGTRAVFLAESTASGGALLLWMTIAFLLESLMVAYLPAEKVVSLLGKDVTAIPLAVLIGIPAYLNGFAALPLVSGLIGLGMSPAVALAFLVAGGVTSIPAATAVWALVKPRVFALYLGLALSGSLGAAYAYSALLALR